MTVPLRALVTRPADDAAETAARLAEMGIEAVIAPATRIEPVRRGPLDLDGAQAVLVTSRNAVRALAGATALRDVALLAVGDATAALAREAGFRSVESAGGDSGDLARLAAAMLDPGAGRLVHAAGEAAGDGLCRDLAGRGFAAAPEVLYRAAPAPLPDGARGLLAAGEIALALFFSAGAARAFADILRREGGEGWCGKIAAICLSGRVAEAAAALPWRGLRRAARPDLASLLAAIPAALEDRRQVDGMGA